MINGAPARGGRGTGSHGTLLECDLLTALRRLYLKKTLGPPVTVVSGLPRSGTSMMMKMLDQAGLELVTDRLRQADEDNPKGYFEYEPVKQLARSADRTWLDDARGKGVKIISTLLRELPAHYNYKVVFMRRDLSEILASQAKMLARREWRSVACCR